MFDILIVEDIHATRKSLVSYLGRVYPQVRIDAAETVAEADALLAAARAAKRRYKVAILDFKLPSTKGENPEIDTALPERVIAQVADDALVFCITAYPNDPLILAYLNRKTLEMADKGGSLRAVAVSKLNSSWAKQVFTVIGRVVHGDRIRGALARLSAPAPGGTVAWNLTHELAAVTADIQKHWDNLDESLQAQIKATFRVEPGPPVRVSLV